MARLVVTRIAPPSQGTKATKRQIEIVVIHSGTKPTLELLRAADALARDLGAGIRLLMPHVVPYPLDLEETPATVNCAWRRCRKLVEGLAIPTRVELRLCRDSSEAVISALAPGSIVVLSSTKVWKWIFEPALAAKLRHLGHQVILPVLE